MSTPSQEPSRLRRMSTRVSRWRNTNRGTKRLKAGLALAANHAKRTNPGLLRQIGRANLTQAELQQLVQSHFAATFGGQQGVVQSQQIQQTIADRLQSATGREGRISRWQDTRRGRKALKGALAQAAKDVKRMDGDLLEQVGGRRLSAADLKDMALGHVENVIRPNGRMGAGPAQQQPPQQAGQQQPEQQAQFTDQLQQIQRQLEVTRLQNELFQRQLESIQLQMAMQSLQPLLQAQQQHQPAQAQGPQTPVQAQGPHTPAQATQTPAQAQGTQAPAQAAQAPAPTRGTQVPAPTQDAGTQGQGAEVSQPAPDSREAYVAAGTGEAIRQPAAQQQADPEQGPPTRLVPNLSAAQHADPQQAPAGHQPTTEQRPPTQEAPNPWAASFADHAPSQGPVTDEAAKAANQQWEPQQPHLTFDRPGQETQTFQVPDGTMQNQADMKGDMARTVHIALSGTTTPKLSADGQASDTSERPPGTEPHRSKGNSAGKTAKNPEL